MSPDARALARSIPFPCETATDRELGRHTITTGIPTGSRPVTLATRVIPITSANRDTCFSVSSRLCDRCVPSRKTLGVRCSDFNAQSNRIGRRPAFVILTYLYVWYYDLHELIATCRGHRGVLSH